MDDKDMTVLPPAVGAVVAAVTAAAHGDYALTRWVLSDLDSVDLLEAASVLGQALGNAIQSATGGGNPMEAVLAELSTEVRGQWERTTPESDSC